MDKSNFSGFADWLITKKAMSTILHTRIDQIMYNKNMKLQRVYKDGIALQNSLGFCHTFLIFVLSSRNRLLLKWPLTP